MEKQSSINNKMPTALTIGAGVVLLVATSHLTAEAAPVEQTDPQPSVTAEQMAGPSLENDRQLEISAIHSALARVATARATTNKAAAIPKVHEIAPPQKPKSARASSPNLKRSPETTAINDFWFGGSSYYHGLLYKARNGHPEVIHNAEVVFEVGKQAGLSNAEIGDLQKIGYRESGLISDAASQTGSAYGIPQATPGDKMASAGADWETNPATQVKWMIHYVDKAYGGPAEAWNFWQEHSWY